MADCRTLNLQRFKALLADNYGPSGSVSHLFREVRHGLWMPDAAPRPRATVVDGGQRRDPSHEGTDSSRLAQEVHIMLDLEEQFDRDGALDAWTAIIQAIIRSVTPWQGGDGNIETVDYIDDNPFEMPAGQGKTLMHWMLRFEVTYFETSA